MPIKPPFTLETAQAIVQAAEDAWNTRDAELVSLKYAEHAQWRNRTEFLDGREAIRAFLRRKWSKELDYRLKKTLWGFRGNRMAVSFDTSGTTMAASGSAPMASSSGSSTTTG